MTFREYVTSIHGYYPPKGKDSVTKMFDCFAEWVEIK